MKSILTLISVLAFILVSANLGFAQAVTASGLTQADLEREKTEWLEKRKTKSVTDMSATEIQVETADDPNKNRTSSSGSNGKDKMIRRTATTADQVEEATP